jgi:hypothetical protein
MRIIFKDKRNSSGVIKAGEIVLYISSRLSRIEQQRHIDILTARLAPRLERARKLAARAAATGLPPGLTPSPVTDDRSLEAWAREINERFYGFAMGQVRFRKQESRWGSCSGRYHRRRIGASGNGRIGGSRRVIGWNSHLRYRSERGERRTGMGDARRKSAACRLDVAGIFLVSGVVA